MVLEDLRPLLLSLVTIEPQRFFTPTVWIKGLPDVQPMQARLLAEGQGAACQRRAPEVEHRPQVAAAQASDRCGEQRRVRQNLRCRQHRDGGPFPAEACQGDGSFCPLLLTRARFSRRRFYRVGG